MSRAACPHATARPRVAKKPPTSPLTRGEAEQTAGRDVPPLSRLRGRDSARAPRTRGEEQGGGSSGLLQALKLDGGDEEGEGGLAVAQDDEALGEPPSAWAFVVVVQFEGPVVLVEDVGAEL